MKPYKKIFDENNILYHGTNSKIDNFSKRKIKRGEAIYLTPDIDNAKSYGDIIYKVAPIKNNIFDFKKQEHVEKLEKEIINIIEDEKKKPYGKGLSFYPFTKDKVLTGVKEGKWNFLEHPIIIKAMKNLNYDGFISKEGQDINYGYFNPNNLKIVNDR